MEAIKWLEEWYASQCDGDWEHCYGVEIGTLDNPGWRVHIDITDTELEGRPFTDIREVDGFDENDWMVCRVEKDFFDGCGDPSKLGAIIEVFRKWASE